MHLNINIDPMAAERYVSLKVVADQLHRNPLMNGIAFEAILDYTVDFLQIVGVPADFIDKYYSIEYKDYRAPLPEDYVECNQLMIDNRVARWATDTFHNLYGDTKTTGNYCINDKLPRSVDYTFTINNSYIYLSKEKGKIEMSYKAIPVDEDGYPMIPDNPVFQRALRMFIEKEHARILYLNDKLDGNKFSKIEQDYWWAVGQWETDSRKLNLSKAEALFNSFRTLIVRDTEFNNRFRNDGAKERLIRH